MKHDNVIMYDAFMWNYNNNAICDDAIFISSYIIETLGHKIRLLIVKERATFGMHIPKF
jgi:hypothetical protein